MPFTKWLPEALLNLKDEEYMNAKLKANLIFLLVSAAWGGTFPIIKAALSQAQPNYFVFVRFTVAALLMLPFIWKDFRETQRGLVTAGLILGLLNIVIYAFQTISMTYISASRCAFITGSFVIMIPFFSALARLAEFNMLDVISAMICTAGLYVLTGANLHGLGIGDLLTFLCAIAYAVAMVYLQYLSQQQYCAKLLSFYQILFTIPFPFFYSKFFETSSSHLGLSFWWGIFYCAVFATIFPMIAQARYQRDTTATQASLIFSLEPIFAAVFSWAFYDEAINQHIFLGGGLIFLSIVLPTLGIIATGKTVN